jgi:hypothetical protein
VSVSEGVNCPSDSDGNDMMGGPALVLRVDARHGQTAGCLTSGRERSEDEAWI